MEVARGNASKIVRGCATVLVALLVVAGLFSYVALPGVIENRLAGILQERLGLQEKPEVEVSSDFPPELLLGRADRVRARTDQVSQQGVTFSDVQAELEGVEVSVASLLRGDQQVEAQSCSLTAEAPLVSLDCGSYLSQPCS